jgi:hypothetical protein
MSLEVHFWHRQDPRIGRRGVLAWKMVDDDARRWAEQEGAALEKVPGSEEIRTDVGGYGAVFFPARSTLAIEQHFDDLGAKPRDDE